MTDDDMNPGTRTPQLLIPVLALAGASLLCLTVFGARSLWTKNATYPFLVWNVFLAHVLLYALNHLQPMPEGDNSRAGR